MDRGGQNYRGPPQRRAFPPQQGMELPANIEPGSFEHQQRMYEQQQSTYNGKKMRQAILRETIDYHPTVARHIENRIWQESPKDMPFIQPDPAYHTQLPLPEECEDGASSVLGKFFHMSVTRSDGQQQKSPIYALKWTPEGRRLLTGSGSGQFTLWNGFTFNFESLLQAHQSAIRCMVWTRNKTWMLTGDEGGKVQYWQANMNNVKEFAPHRDPVRAISFAPTDVKFATCSDDGTIRIWDFEDHSKEERILRGHGSDVISLDWHPTKGLLASGSRDAQQPVMLWDPRTTSSISTLHMHRDNVCDIKWSSNGNWLLTASKDTQVKLFDIRAMKEMQVFRAHTKDATCLAWHPIHEDMFASAGGDGAVYYWTVGEEENIGGVPKAHDGAIWTMDWHPLGHLLATGSNDHTCKFWTRNRPGDPMTDRYNKNTDPPVQGAGGYQRREGGSRPNYGERGASSFGGPPSQRGKMY